jgi:4-amino-4-deoxy-L-arabinose transferase-like glycosyltransferase
MLSLKHKGVILVFCIALLLRLALIAAVYIKNPDGIWVYDSYSYWQIGHNMVTNGAYSQSFEGELQPDSFRTPLYPLLMAGFQLTGPGSLGMIALQLLLSSLTAVIVYNSAFKLFCSRRAALIAGLIIALDIPSIIFTGLILTETVFTFLFSASVYYMISYLENRSVKLLVSSGIFHSLAMLCRPVALFTFMAFIIIVIISQPGTRSRIKMAVIYCSTTLLLLLPWLVRNQLAFSSVFLSTIDAHVLHNYHASSILSEKYGLSFRDAQVRLRLHSAAFFKGDAVKDEVEYAKYCRKKALDIINNNKGIFLKQHFYNVFSFLFKPARGYVDNMLGYTKGYHTASAKDFPLTQQTYVVMKELSSRFTFLLVIIQVVLMIVVYTGLLAGILAWRKHSGRIQLLMLLLLLAYFVNVTVPPYTDARFRVPAMPLIALISACGLAYFRLRLSRK